ncbi:MAG: hypothetical protein M3Q60_20150 [Actinomycetota bacterium]|nr:hypothetical protein [Actinomycetota bacterium]
MPSSSNFSVHSLRRSTCRAATEGTASRRPTKPKSVTTMRRAKTITTGWSAVAQLITTGSMTFPSMDWITT